MAAHIRLPLRILPNWILFRQQTLLHTEAGLKEPTYPPVVPSLTAKSQSAVRRRAEEQVARIKASSVEEKLRLITRIQRKKFVVYPQTFARNADRWYQHFTKTAYIPGLPEKFTQIEGPGLPGEEFAELRSIICNTILQEHCFTRRPRVFLYRRQELVFGPFLRNLAIGLTSNLAKYNPLLRFSSLDYGPEVNFYWRRGQRIIPRGHRRGHLEPTCFQVDDRPHCQIRTAEQLPQFTPIEASYSAEVPEVTYAPNLMPLFRRQYENHIFTGSKLPDPIRYGHTQFHLVPDRYHRDRMARQQQSDQVEVFLRANAMASLFAWTGAQAVYQGFWDQEDVTRPFASQAVITDGRFFSFFCYQLNTLALSVEADAGNPRRNLLWGTESMPLYEDVRDGQVVGLNDGVITLLVRFLLNQ